MQQTSRNPTKAGKKIRTRRLHSHATHSLPKHKRPATTPHILRRNTTKAIRPHTSKRNIHDRPRHTRKNPRIRTRRMATIKLHSHRHRKRPHIHQSRQRRKRNRKTPKPNNKISKLHFSLMKLETRRARHAFGRDEKRNREVSLRERIL